MTQQKTALSPHKAAASIRELLVYVEARTTSFGPTWTEDPVEALRALCGQLDGQGGWGPGDEPSVVWESGPGVVSLNGEEIHRFKQPAGVQRTVLDKFQEGNWEHPADMTGVFSYKWKTGISNTVSSMNQWSQPHGLVFHGAGELISWDTKPAIHTSVH